MQDTSAKSALSPSEAPPTIDWGNNAAGTTPAEAPASINWDVDVSGGQEQFGAVTPAINWDVEVPEAGGDAEGGGENGADVSPAIDWGIDISALGAEEASGGGEGAPQINWDVEVPEASDGADPTAGSGPTINWDIDLTEAAEASGPVEINWGVGMEDGAKGGVGTRDEKGGGVEHPLSNADFRRALLDDLFEVGRLPSVARCVGRR